MKKLLILFICLFIFNYILEAQNYYYSTGCYSDVVRANTNSSDEIWRSQYDIGIFTNSGYGLVEGGRIISDAFNAAVTTQSSSRVYRILEDSGCPSSSDESCCFTHNLTNTIDVKLYRNNTFISTILLPFTYNNSISAAHQFQDAIGNYELPPDLTYGSGYQVRYHFEQHDETGFYTNPFDYSTTITTGAFSIGNPSHIISPFQNEIIDNLLPNFVWEQRPNGLYKVVVGLADSPPVLTYDLTTHSYEVSNEVYQSDFQTDTTLQLPTAFELQLSTDYIVYIITSFDDVEYKSYSNFSTSSALPLNFVDFYGRIIEKQVFLNWKTTDEFNNNMFEIQRANDCSNWIEIGSVEGSTGSSEINMYNFVDKYPLKNQSYYRVKQVDFDGSYAFSKIISILNLPKDEDEDIEIFPNPTNDIINISNCDLCNVTISDFYGRIVEVYKYKGGIRILHLQNGVYFIRVETSNGIIIRKIVKK